MTMSMLVELTGTDGGHVAMSRHVELTGHVQVARVRELETGELGLGLAPHGQGPALGHVLAWGEVVRQNVQAKQ